MPVRVHRRVVVRVHGEAVRLRVRPRVLERVAHAARPGLLLPRRRRRTPHVRRLQLLNHLHLLLDQVVEQDNLVLQLHPHVVSHEEVGVLLLKLLPHQRREARLDARLVLEGEDDVLLRHVLLQAPLDEVLHILNVRAADHALACHAVRLVAAVAVLARRGPLPLLPIFPRGPAAGLRPAALRRPRAALAFTLRARHVSCWCCCCWCLLSVLSFFPSRPLFFSFGSSAHSSPGVLFNVAPLLLLGKRHGVARFFPALCRSGTLKKRKKTRN
mmetsp:Transcript_12834/g.33235  ORF Transcript_12834/g.33235 Transcript_12834/m.33235 type:complete len:271 (+) Transcript_12834:1685-2497(+)